MNSNPDLGNATISQVSSSYGKSLQWHTALVGEFEESRQQLVTYSSKLSIVKESWKNELKFATNHVDIENHNKSVEEGPNVWRDPNSHFLVYMFFQGDNIILSTPHTGGISQEIIFSIISIILKIVGTGRSGHKSGQLSYCGTQTTCGQVQNLKYICKWTVFQLKVSTFYIHPWIIQLQNTCIFNSVSFHKHDTGC